MVNRQIRLILLSIWIRITLDNTVLAHLKQYSHSYFFGRESPRLFQFPPLGEMAGTIST